MSPDQPSDPQSRRPALFREEALRHHTRAREYGNVVRRPPRWTRIAYPLVVVTALAGVIGLVVGRATGEARGPAVVRAEGERFAVQAILPAALRDRLRVGSSLRVSVAGHPVTWVEVSIDRLGERAIDPPEARRLLGPAGEESGTELPGTGVEAWAGLPGSTFVTADGSEHAFVEGMAAVAETKVRGEPLIFALFPGLRSALSL